MLGLILLAIALYLFRVGRFYPSLMLFFLLLTNGFQVIPVNFLMAGIPLEKGADLAIIFVMIICITRYSIIKSFINEYPIFKGCLLIILFVLADAAYSLIILHYSPVNVIQVFRPYLLLLSFLPFFEVEGETLKKVFDSLAIITIFQSVLFLLQIITGKIILLSPAGNTDVGINIISVDNYVRYYNTPAFLDEALFYFLYIYKFKNRFYQILACSILILTVIGPMHRSMILAVVAVISIYALLKQNSSKRIISLSFIGLTIYAASFIGVISYRMDKAFKDLKNTFSSNLAIQEINPDENTLDFRIAHFEERFDYIVKKPFGWLFGIGLISDHASYASKLPFQVGLISQETGTIEQIDTSDLIWSPLVLTLGIVGTIIYVTFFVILMLRFFKASSINKYGILGFLTILTALLLSMTGIELIDDTFRVMILMITVLMLKSGILPEEDQNLKYEPSNKSNYSHSFI
jgi:hypothetical protein